MKRKERFDKFIAYFSKYMPVAESELKYSDPYELIVAVILSAQCTDKRVNMITPPLLKRFPTSKVMAKAKVSDVFDYIKSCSYPNSKAKHLVGMAKTLENEFHGIVPSDIDQLQHLPGVGRKSANVIASVIYNKPVIAVDTHVFRVSKRIGLSHNAKNPLETEEQLYEFIPADIRPKAHHWLILHGRYICLARKPKCDKCGLTEICVYFKSKNK